MIYLIKQDYRLKLLLTDLHSKQVTPTLDIVEFTDKMVVALSTGQLT